MANLKDTFVLGKLTVTDSIIADKFKGPLEGNAATATKFNTSRTFSFAGDVSGTVTTDCASGFEVNLSVLNYTHSHTYDHITNLDVPLDQWLESAKSYTDGKISDLVNGAGASLDTLKELADALNNDASFATTVTDLIATKIPLTGTNSTTGPITGGLTFSVADAIKYKGTKNTYTMIKFIDNTTDVNGNGIMIGGGGSVYIGSGESAANLYSALSNPSGGDEAIYISGDDAIKFYSNCQTIKDRKETTYDKSGNWTMPGQITATQFNGAATRIALGGVADSTKYGAYAGIIQSSTGGPEPSAWHNSIKILHNNPDGYYTQLAHNFTGSHGLWHRSCRGGTISNWIKILDSNNYQGVLDNTYLQLAGGTMTGALHAHGGITVNATTAQATTPPFILGIKSFDDGGNVTWSNREDVSVGHADAATVAEATYTNNVSGDTHAIALKNYFDSNKATTPRNKLLSFYSSAYGNGSQCMGYFLNGYNDNPYGGFFVAHYNAPRYVGIQNGTYTEWELSKVGHNHDDIYLKLTGGTISGGLTVNGKATFTGGVDIRGSAANKPLIVRAIVGSDGSGTVDALYLQYGANKPVYFGNTGSYTISANGANYSGNAATASALTDITTSDNASSSDVKRRIWFAYSNNTTGRPAYDDRFTIQTSTGTLFAPIFSGNLSGTATKALQDGDGLVIKDTYLKLSGGTITGGLTVNGSTLLKSTLTIGSSTQSVSPKVGIRVHDLRNLGRGQSGDEPAPWPGLFGDNSVNFYFDEINDSYGGGTAANRWMSIMHMKGWTGAYAAWELAGNAHSDSNQDTLRYRQGINNSWGAWQSVLTDANFTTYLDSTYVNVTGDTMTGTLTLTSPANSSEGGQLVLAHTQNSNTQNGIVIDTANSDFRVFGNPSKTGTAKSNYGSILTYSPYDLKLSIHSMSSGSGHFQYNTSDKCIDVLFT